MESSCRTPLKQDATLTRAWRDHGVTYATAGAPNPKAGKRRLGSGSLGLPTPQGGSAPTAGTRTLSGVPTPAGEICFSARRGRSPLKWRHGRRETSGFHGNRDAQPGPPHRRCFCTPSTPPGPQVKAKHLGSSGSHVRRHTD